MSPTLDWSEVTRGDPAFEQVMCYYHVDRVQERLQALGITHANARRQRVDAHASGEDNSYYDIYMEEMGFGDGGVDDAEDADVIRHEYGHALQYDQVPNWGIHPHGRAMGEGFGDFLAVAFHEGNRSVWDPLFASWDATTKGSHLPHLRRADTDKRFPEDYRGKAHADGEIWSRFLWDILQRIGTDDALRVVIESHFFLTANADFEDGANAILLANRVVREGAQDAILRMLLEDRGLPFDVVEVPPPSEDDLEDNDALPDAVAIGPGTHERLLLADEDWYRIGVGPNRRVLVLALLDASRPDVKLSMLTPGGELVAETFASGGTAELSVEAGSAGAEFLVRMEPGGVPVGYDLTVTETELEELVSGRTLWVDLTGRTRRVFRIAVSAELVEKRKTLRVKVRRFRRKGAKPELTLASPSGESVIGVRRKAGRRAKAVVQVEEAGFWTAEIRAEEGTSGGVKIKARFRRR